METEPCPVVNPLAQAPRNLGFLREQFPLTNTSGLRVSGQGIHPHFSQADVAKVLIAWASVCPQGASPHWASALPSVNLQRGKCGCGDLQFSTPLRASMRNSGKGGPIGSGFEQQVPFTRATDGPQHGMLSQMGPLC